MDKKGIDGWDCHFKSGRIMVVCRRFHFFIQYGIHRFLNQMRLGYMHIGEKDVGLQEKNWYSFVQKMEYRQKM